MSECVGEVKSKWKAEFGIIYLTSGRTKGPTLHGCYFVVMATITQATIKEHTHH